MKNKKDVIINLYKESINDIIWTHKIQATVLDKLRLKNKVYKIIKELLVGIASFISVIFLYCEVYIGALITSAITTISVIVDNVFNFSNYENRIRISNDNVNDLWYMKKLLTMKLEYLKNDIIDWEEAKKYLETNLEYRKTIYSKLESPSKKEMKQAEYKLKNRKDEEINNEFFNERDK